jgi:20S proteasome subunit beta 6
MYGCRPRSMTNQGRRARVPSQRQQTRGTRCARRLWIVAIWCVSGTFQYAAVGASSSFDPYEMNGGLIAGVAGADYVILAADTRLSRGMEILQRHHTASRLWSVLPSHVAQHMQDVLQRHATTQAHAAARPEMATATEPHAETIALPAVPWTATTPPVWIGSAGCSTDCEALKRRLQSQVRQALATGEVAGAAPDVPRSLAVWVSQTLYGRRTMPYYAFCVLAGCTAQGGGHVYGYDAIGSYERLAVAVEGQGRNILQAILDRSLHSAVAPLVTATADSDGSLVTRVVPTPVQVTETAEEALALLIAAFRAVAHRDVAVGDSVVLLCWQMDAAANCLRPSVTWASLPRD